MNIPIQSSPVLRGRPTPLSTMAAGVNASCSLGDQIKCCGLVAGLTAACATIETGVGAIACAAAIAGYVSSDCYDCACGEPLKATVCGWIEIINKIPGIPHISVPSFC